MTPRIARAYWALGKGSGELRNEALPTQSADKDILIRAEWSGVSVGTERLVGRGLVPPDAWSRMACPHMGGQFSFPVKYGYSLVGTVEAGPHRGERVFALHPHQDWAMASADWVTILPRSVPGHRAALVANLETALNAVWEAEPHRTAKPVVVGAGALGLLVAYVLHSETRLRPTVVELDPARRQLAAGLTFVGEVLSPDAVSPGVFDVAWHTSASSSGLNLALQSVGFEGRVIELSWYGASPVTLDLGSHFHFDRKRLISSQVSAVAPSRRDQIRGPDRREAAVRLLLSDELDCLLSPPLPFESLPSAMSRLYSGADLGLVPLVSYP